MSERKGTMGKLKRFILDKEDCYKHVWFFSKIKTSIILLHLQYNKNYDNHKMRGDIEGRDWKTLLKIIQKDIKSYKIWVMEEI